MTPGLVAVSWLAVYCTGSHLWWWSGPVAAFCVVPALDALVGKRPVNPPESAYDDLDADPFYRWATYLYIPNQLGAVVLACWLWAGGGWVSMSLIDKLGLMCTVGIIGGIGINVGHELSHRRLRHERRLSKLALAQTCYGHFYVEHNMGHHTRVATPEDAASARLGESVYEFIPRSAVGGARSAWRIEARRQARRGRSTWTLHNHVLSTALISATLFTVLTLWFGVAVLPWLVGQAVLGFSLLEAVNYIEHFGLRRRRLPSGRYEPVQPGHSWNSSTALVNVFLFNLQRHSDHHVNPQRRYQNLRHLDEAPQLPFGYGATLLMALVPPLWSRVMTPRVVAHYGGDIRLAALAPRREKQLLKRYAPTLP